MINVSSYTTALFNKIVAAAITGVTAERGERINFDPGRCPWVGVYPGPTSSAPKTIGGGPNRWASNVGLIVIAQTASFVDDGQKASDDLEALAGQIEQVVDNDLTLGLTGFRILNTSRDYRYIVLDDDGNGSVFMPQVQITFNGEARSS